VDFWENMGDAGNSTFNLTCLLIDCKMHTVLCVILNLVSIPSSIFVWVFTKRIFCLIPDFVNQNHARGWINDGEISMMREWLLFLFHFLAYVIGFVR